MDPGGRGARRPPPQLLHGQRRRPPGRPAAAARRGLRAAPAQVGPGRGATTKGRPSPEERARRPRAGLRGERRHPPARAPPRAWRPEDRAGCAG